MPEYVIERTARALNRHGKSLKGSKALVLGLSYKADIDDDRESPSFEIIERLRAEGAEVAYCDPYIPVARPGREHDIRLSSVPCTAEEFARHDVLVVSTAHSDFKDAGLYAGVKLVVDTRNLMAPLGPRRAGRRRARKSAGRRRHEDLRPRADLPLRRALGLGGRLPAHQRRDREGLHAHLRHQPGHPRRGGAAPDGARAHLHDAGRRDAGAPRDPARAAGPPRGGAAGRLLLATRRASPTRC